MGDAAAACASQNPIAQSFQELRIVTYFPTDEVFSPVAESVRERRAGREACHVFDALSMGDADAAGSHSSHSILTLRSRFDSCHALRSFKTMSGTEKEVEIQILWP